MMRSRAWVVQATVAISVLAACGGDDAASGTSGEENADQAAPDDSPVGSGDASAELTVDGETYSFEGYAGCVAIDDGTGFTGHGAGPGGAPAELSVSYYADPPASDVPGGEWTLTATEDGDTPGIATGADLWTAHPGILRSEGDGFDVRSDGSAIRISGPAERADGSGSAHSEVVVTCG